jgi:hypothetical protein
MKDLIQKEANPEEIIKIEKQGSSNDEREVEPKDSAKPFFRDIKKTMNAFFIETPEDGDFAAPPKFLIPLSCVYHVFMILVVFLAYVWLDQLSN